MCALERVIVTGSTGFVGRSLVAQLDRPPQRLHFGSGDWLAQVQSTDFARATVFHLAARAHSGGSAQADFLADNRDKTAALAQAAAAGGAQRLVFLSSIKVNGEETRGRPFRADDAPAPQDAYGRSKREAERVLAEIGQRAGLEYCIVRSPLVYGPHARGNLRALMHLADSPLPLPFAAVANRRSFVHVDDLARLLIECALQPQAAGKIYLAAHADPVSTPRLITHLRQALGRPPRLFAAPAALLSAVGALTGQVERFRRLTRSLELDVEPTQRELGWTAQVCIETAIEDMVHSFRSDASS